MYYLQYRVWPRASHPHCERLGEGLVCCWIDRHSLAQADRIARRAIRSEHWDVLEREYGEPIREEDYEEGDKHLQYYQQATIDREVFSFNTSPRHPAFWVVAAVTGGPAGSGAEAHYFLSGDSILQEGEDVYDPRFWSGKRRDIALAGVSAAVASQGWVVARIVQARPCGRGDVPEDLAFYYDEAEDSGSCLVFVHDDEPDPAVGHDTG